MALNTNHRARPVLGSFAAELVRQREQAGLSLSRLAARAGYDHSYISRLESGDRAPARSAVLAIARALGCDEQDRDRLLVSAGYAPMCPYLQHVIRGYLNMPATISEGRATRT